MTWLVLLLSCLLVYAVSRMVSQEDGPFDMFTRWRAWLGQSSWVGRGFHCFMCVSTYVSALVVLLLLLMHRVAWAEAWLAWGSIAGGARVIYQVVR